jgi:hypothetical protein
MIESSTTRSPAVVRFDSTPSIDTIPTRSSAEELQDESKGSEVDAESRPPRANISYLRSQSSMSTQWEPQWGADHRDLHDHLRRLRHTDDEGQAGLERAYIEASAQAFADRKAELGEEFVLAESMPSQMSAGGWAACYEACSGAISSAARSPVRNVIGVEFNGSSEITLPLSQALISGAVGGVTAYMAAEWVIKAADRKAKKYNFKKVVPIDLKKALPYPCEIELTVVGATKTYRLRDADEMTQARAAVGLRRAALAAVQARLLGNGEFSPYAQGFITGALNVVRRLGPASDLLDSGRVFATSVAASAAGGFLAKGAFGLLKVSPLARADVDDLVGGQQQISLFRVRNSDPESDRTATWRDVASFAKDTACEFGALGLHRLTCADAGWQEQAKDVTSHALMNAIASVGSAAVGGFVATALRGPTQFGPRAGEAHDSPGFLVQQFFQSAVNDYLWNAAKKFTGSPVSDLAATLDAQRARAPRRRAPPAQADSEALV